MSKYRPWRITVWVHNIIISSRLQSLILQTKWCACATLGFRFNGSAKILFDDGVVLLKHTRRPGKPFNPGAGQWFFDNYVKNRVSRSDTVVVVYTRSVRLGWVYVSQSKSLRFEYVETDIYFGRETQNKTSERRYVNHRYRCNYIGEVHSALTRLRIGSAVGYRQLMIPSSTTINQIKRMHFLPKLWSRRTRFNFMWKKLENIGVKFLFDT